MEYTMRKIIKYSEQKLYDTIEYIYISLNSLSELVKSGEQVIVVDNETGDDITETIITQIRSSIDQKDNKKENLLKNIIEKSCWPLFDYSKKYNKKLFKMFNKAEEEIDTLINKCIGDKTGKYIKEVIIMLNLATKEQVTKLIGKIKKLTQNIDKLEKSYKKYLNTQKKNLNIKK